MVKGIERVMNLAIILYSGTPGSGKSYHAVRDILDYNRKKKYVVSNFDVDSSFLKNKEIFFYVDNSSLTVSYLVNLSYKKFDRNKENQCLLVIDEAQIRFNSRLYGEKDRMEWIKFFSQHRKLGYQVILVSQSDRMIDRQIRTLIEYEVKHRKLNNYKFFWILPFPVFVCTRFWYGLHEYTDISFILYRKKFSRAYNTFSMFNVGPVSK